jgi:hypothetical protein
MIYGDNWTPISDSKRFLELAELNNRDEEVEEPQENEEDARNIPGGRRESLARLAKAKSVLEKFPELAEGRRTEEQSKDYVKDLSDRIKIIQHSASVIQRHQIAVRNASKNDKARKNDEFRLGSLVLRLLPAKDDKRLNKLEATAVGPYKIISRVSEAVYRLASIVQPGELIDVHERELYGFDLDDTYPKIAVFESAQHDLDEFNIDSIVGHEGTSKNTLKFIVKFADEQNTRTVLPKQLLGTALLNKYLEEHKEVQDLLRGVTRRKEH